MGDSETILDELIQQSINRLYNLSDVNDRLVETETLQVLTGIRASERYLEMQEKLQNGN